MSTAVSRKEAILFVPAHTGLAPVRSTLTRAHRPPVAARPSPAHTGRTPVRSTLTRAQQPYAPALHPHAHTGLAPLRSALRQLVDVLDVVLEQEQIGPVRPRDADE